MRRRIWLLLPLLVLVLAAAACGGGDSSTSSESEASPDASIPLDTGDSSTPAPSPTPSPASPSEPAPSEATGTEAPGAIKVGAAPIKKGSKKANVLALQESLDYLGYSVGTPDGVFGAKTKKAINDFQKDNGIKATGVADKKTITAINKQVKEAAAGTSPAAPPTQSDVTDTGAATDTAATDTAAVTTENTEDQ